MRKFASFEGSDLVPVVLCKMALYSLHAVGLGAGPEEEGLDPAGAEGGGTGLREAAGPEGEAAGAAGTKWEVLGA